MDSIPEPERLDAQRLVDDICKQGQDARFFQNIDELLGFLLQSARSGDLIVCMSNGSFDGLTQKLAAGLALRSHPNQSGLRLL
jgi:UDP-N-acetylmuramate: L-alanyl-gamma-D-glutamyl-meso-diaminopimelate ligase